MATILVIAPHPDDETLGCGGTLHRHRADGDSVHWLICTEMDPVAGYSEAQRRARDAEIGQVAELYGFAAVHRLGYPTTRLDTLPLAEVIENTAAVFAEVRPDIAYLPFRDDIHGDHRIAFDAAAACCKAFRNPDLREVLVYETLSETGINPAPGAAAFRPNHYVDITDHIEDKLRALRCFAGELDAFPFPRSEEAVRALAALRGSECGRAAAEAFMVVRQTR